MFLMLLMFLMLVAIIATVGVLIWFSCQRVAVHLRGNPDATKAVVEHVLIPLFGSKPEGDDESAPDDALGRYDALYGEAEYEA